MAQVELENARLTFHMTRNGPVRWRDWWAHKLGRGDKNPIIDIHALDDVNLKIGDGDRVGVVGHNGSGKSTLLKVIAGIYPLARGTRKVEGEISSLFDVFLGFEMDATGRENIAYRGYLQGETRASLRAKQDEIAEFTGLGEHLDMPVRYYSEGMKVRLGFSIATAIEPDILLIDEVIGAGDLDFQQKARERITRIMSNSSIVVAVSHNHHLLKELCNKIIWVQDGRIQMMGDPDETVAAYEEEVRQRWIRLKDWAQAA